MAEWWRNAERTWERNRAPATTLSLREQIDFQGKLRGQFPITPHRVVYTRSGQYLAACRIEDAEAVIEQTLYWAAVDSVDEGRYLAAILNSQTLSDAVTPLQSRGQHNPRDFALRVFALPFPRYDASDSTHQALSGLGEQAEALVAELEFDPAAQFQKARRATREALVESGLAREIDAAVAALLAEAPVAGDDLGIITAATP